MILAPFRDRGRLSGFHWPAVGAGLLVALGLHIVFTALGLGIAFLDETGDGGFAAIGLLIWSGVTWVAASFVGGYVTAWVADSSRYAGGLFHGLVLWGALTLALLYLPPSTMGIGASDALPSADIISWVAWFIGIGGLVSFGTTICGALVGSRAVEQADLKSADSYRAA